MKKNSILKFAIAGAATAAGAAIAVSLKPKIPTGAQPIENFDLTKYLGRWYEIARLDHKFEKNLDNCTANYSFDESRNMVTVRNRGFDTIKGKWKESIGVAKFRGKPNVAMLKVSFLQPIYSSYNILCIEGDYEYALVVGNTTDYAWLLSRTTEIPNDIKLKFLRILQDLKFSVNELIWVNQDKEEKGKYH